MSDADSFDINNITAETLAALNLQQIIRVALTLKEENQKLLVHANDDLAKKYDERLERLERELNLQKQYERRTCIEITGIPDTVPDEEIENSVINVMKAAGVKIHNRDATYFDIQAAHRKGKKGVVICKFVNRKFAYGAVSNSYKLKNKDVFENGSKVYVNPSLCPEFGYLHFAVRKAKRDGIIHSYKVRHGVMNIVKTEGGDWVEISHENDLTRSGIELPTRSY